MGYKMLVGAANAKDKDGNKMKFNLLLDKTQQESEAAINSLAETKKTEIQNVGREVLDSIPEDYQRLSESIVEIKDALETDTIENDFFKNQSISSDGTISTSSIRLLSDMLFMPAGSSARITGGFSFRFVKYVNGVFYDFVNSWGTTVSVIGDTYVRINIKRDDNGEISPKDVEGKIETIGFSIDEPTKKVYKKTETKENAERKYSEIKNLIDRNASAIINTENSIQDMKDILESENELYEKDTDTVGVYYLADGTKATSTSFAITKDIEVNSKYEYSYFGIKNTGTKPYCVFKDANGNVLESESFRTVVSEDYINLHIPQTAKYIAFSINTADRYHFSFIEKKLEVVKKEDLEVNNFSLNKVMCGAENMMWSWWYYPQVMSTKKVRNKVYWTFTSHEGYTGIAEYNFDTKETKKNILKQSEADDHNASAVFVYNDGTIMCAYSGGHNTDKQMHIRVSSTPESIENFEEEIALDSIGTTSYGQIIYNYDTETLFLFYRVNNTSWGYRYTRNKGKTWSDEVILITATMQYYCKFSKTNTRNLIRICMYSNPGSSDSNIRMGFMDLNTMKVYNSDNSTLVGERNLPYTLFNILIPTVSNKTQRLFDVAKTDYDKPLILYCTFNTTATTVNHECEYFIWDNGSIIKICDSGKFILQKYPNGCAWISDTKFIVGRNIGDDTGEDIIETYSYADGTATKIKEITRESLGDIPIRNARPIVDVNGKTFLWHRGQYSIEFTNFNSDAKLYDISKDEILF